MKKALHFLKLFNEKLVDFSDYFSIRKKNLKLIVSIGLFVLGIHAFYSYLGVYKYLDRRPCSVHSWAQCQRASIAQSYYRDNMNFFLPRTQNYTKNGGITGVEFPIIYYSAAVCYKLFGFNEIYLRVISLSIVTLGIFFFFLLVNKFLGNPFISLATILCAFVSPVLLFYSPNFLPDAPSVGFVLMAWYFFFKFLDSNQKRDFNIFILCATVAALLKAVALICLIIIICILILDRLKFFKSTGKIFLLASPRTVLVKIILSFAIVLSWYLYANWLAIKYENETFCLRPLSVDFNVMEKLIPAVKNFWLYQYYSYESYVLLIGALLLISVLYKFANKLLVTITLLYILGSACYVILFAGQFINHDYYIITIIPSVFFLLLSFANVITKLANTHFITFKVLLFVTLFFNLKECLKNCKLNYNERYSSESLYWSYVERSFYDLEPKLRMAGIKRTDVTLAAFDETFCNDLYLMDQIGYPINTGTTENALASIIARPESKYLVVTDSSKFRKLYPYDLSSKIILYHRGLLVYKLK